MSVNLYAAVCGVFFHRRRFSFFYALRAVGHKQDLHGSEDDPQVLENRGVRHVGKIHQQLVVGARVVFAVNLGVAGKTGLRLQTQGEFGQCLVVLFGDLRAFGTRSHDGEVARQDVDQLGQFVDAHFADKTPHPGDPVVFVAGRKSGHAVFLSVRAHAAELDDVELFAVLRQPALAVEDRAAVLQLDAERRDEHDGRCDDQADQREHDVSEPLDDGIFQRRVIALHLQHRQMEQMGAFGGLYDQVAHPGDQVGLDGMHQAVLRDDVAVMAVDPR